MAEARLAIYLGATRYAIGENPMKQLITRYFQEGLNGLPVRLLLLFPDGSLIHFDIEVE